MNVRPSSAPRLLTASAIALLPPVTLVLGTAVAVAVPPACAAAERRSPPSDTVQPSSNAATNVLFRTQGVLESGDLVVFQDGSLYDEYIYQGREGQQLTILLESQDFVPYLIIMNHTGDILAQSEDITTRHTDTTIAVTLPADGPYSVIVNGFTRYSRGHYTLTVSGRSPGADPADVPATVDGIDPEAPSPQVPPLDVTP
ncbi:MAG: hypothetical protein ACFB8W_02885 [Elainellaceae cyanobacterium]